MKKIIVTIVSMCLLTAATLAGEFDTNKWALTLSGNGSTVMNSDNSTSVGTEIGLSYSGFAGLPNSIETGVRQGIRYNSDDSTVAGSTALNADWNVRLFGKLYVFVGGEISGGYGEGCLAWTGGPEAGVKLFVKNGVFIYGRANYDFVLNNCSANDEDVLRYGLGIGFRFK